MRPAPFVSGLPVGWQPVQCVWRTRPQMGQVATPVSGSSRMKLAQPFVLQNRWLWLVRRMRRAELARAANAAGARIVRVDIMV